MIIKGERLYTTMALMDILDMCTEITGLQFVDDYVAQIQNLYNDTLVTKIRIHIHNSIKYLKHGNNFR